MSALVQRAMDWLRGEAGGDITVPPMDGPLRPNQLLEEARVAAELPAPDNLVAAGGRLLCTSGRTLLELHQASGATLPIAVHDFDIACLASGPDGTLALGLDNGSILIERPDGTRSVVTTFDGTAIRCPTALAFTEPGTLAVTLGSADNPPSRWKHDLMALGASGSFWTLDISSGAARRLASGLAWPAGVMALADGGIAITESWRHRVLVFRNAAAPETVLADLPGYPSRLVAASGGASLCVFAPRSQLIEFVLTEPAFRARMTAEIAPDHWIAPSLSPARSFLEPLQGGALKQLGRLKPWAPTRSYGLLLWLDAGFRPISSLHSRADGRRHGITSCASLGDTLYVASKGGDAVLALPETSP